ncbi:FAD:protein FMN transferase [Paenibacillus sp. OV219]|uniref:FAD:protein FMN transferase n=1 Tax=Paenibacillus sp. OV219 TaxID=1884377 RepID=UPI0008C250E2|nr:FAD:protein FMN transferase [Paenibacillus sp. OV219]SEO51148.1 thiamine biosynthesis lipoprotein [Paenibacillus sp. OV219]
MNTTLHQFRTTAMNTQIELKFATEQGARVRGIARFAEDWFQKTELRFTRFREVSELSRLNQRIGERCMLSDAMLEVLLLAELYRSETGGIFDPCMLGAIETCGYDRSFEQLASRLTAATGTTKLASVTMNTNAAHPQTGVQSAMDIDPGMKSVLLHAPLDLGGIVKAWSVQRLASYMMRKLAVTQGIINAGGDLAVWGAPESDPWLVAIEHPWQQGEDIGVLALCDGAAATSSKLGRRWTIGGNEKHHLLDPRTLQPSRSDVEQCTVTGPDAVTCEIWAKTICILGASEGIERFKNKTKHYEALLFGVDRRVHYCGSRSSFESASKWRGVSIDQAHWRTQT